MNEFNEKSAISGIDEIKNLFGHLVTQEEIGNQIKVAQKKIIEGIQQKPMVAVAVAGGVGFVIGLILKR